MYLKKLRVWNFRCFGRKENDQPGLEIDFDPKLNLLIGANDSGKTAIIDAIRICLGTQTYDPIRIDVEDFYQNPESKERATELKIECTFSNITYEEAGQFLEWIDLQKDEEKQIFELRVWFVANNKDNRISTTLKAGIDDEGNFLVGDARDLLRVTYLKPLRDAETELAPGNRSRLFQILRSHQIFNKKDVNEKHPFEKFFERASKYVENFFDKDNLDKDDGLGITGTELGGKKILQSFISQMKNFLEINDAREPTIKITPTELNAILKKLELLLEENKSGLGTLNLLYMAAELIHLKREQYLGLRLVLIEELEAHLHPQAQLRVLKSLLSETDLDIQLILTSHSTLLGSSIPLKHIKLCYNSNVYSLDCSSTELSESDYQFLERFLDSTKANLFFARGVIIVEGDAENLIIPTIAEIIDRPLHKYGVSIVNVGSKALLRYVNIFKRKDSTSLPIKVAVVTDLDCQIDDQGQPIGINDNDINEKRKEICEKFDSNDGNIKTFVSQLKTLEFDIALGNLYEYMNKAILIAKKIKSNQDWITEYEINSNSLKLNENNVNKRAAIIYKPLQKNEASKSVTAQWFAKLLIDNKEDAISLIKQDYKNNIGIKYIIEAIEHVTKKVDWDESNNN